jgi:hypothetical protein
MNLHWEMRNFSFRKNESFYINIFSIYSFSNKFLYSNIYFLNSKRHLSEIWNNQ